MVSTFSPPFLAQEKEKERLKRKAGGVAAITEKDSKRRKLEEEERVKV